MATDVKTEDIILAAITAAGPIPSRSTGEVHKGTWMARVRDLAAEITTSLSPESSLSKLVEEFKKAEKPFTAILLGGNVEERTGRAIIRFRSLRSKDEGEDEEVRTKHLNTADGARIWEHAKTLKHHKVVIHKFLEEKDGKRYRLLLRLDDLGPASAEDLAAAGIQVPQASAA
ncbi:hypothetical protein CHO01_28870 [Cellulomonas hominis]|uniref:Uncharacterized protein n=1 Tax=Cellulomonas hominis TaxID=156981 RepID=A0A511FEV8_9CELL|nr:hypothetical protein [Cellulomonas hominis]MBB5474762.1 hypothetical protein [Cellulomonas hominis]NKY05418.1 hypothetical protein [Cellulomonas hominis]GEL47771.1 hypothetical protein CHO01_28870 [Cellulomonas hominis]